LNIKLKDEMFNKLYADLENEGLVMGIDEKQLKAKIKKMFIETSLQKSKKVEVEQMKYILRVLILLVMYWMHHISLALKSNF